MATPAAAQKREPAPAASPATSTVSAEARAVHEAATPIDLHSDTTKFLARGYDIWKRHEPSWLVRGIGGHVDIPRMREGNLCGQFFSMWTFPKPEAGCFAEVNRQIDAYRKKRQESQPREPSAGCVFKNPPQDSAGRLHMQEAIERPSSSRNSWAMSKFMRSPA